MSEGRGRSIAIASNRAADAPVEAVRCQSSEAVVFPAGWASKALRDVAPLQRGFDLPTSQVRSGRYPVVYSNGILRRHNRAMVKGPGVVTGRSGTIGKVHFVAEDYWPHNTALWVVSYRRNDPRFIYYLYTHIRVARFLAGSGVPTLNRNDVHQHVIPLPPLHEQRAIAAVLMDVDALIGSLEALIAKKRAIKQAAMQQLLTGRTRLPGFRGEWETRRLGNHLRFLRHGSFPRSYLAPNGEVGGGVKYLHYGDIHTSARVYLDPTATALPALAKDYARRLDRLSDGDLVFVDASEDVGGVGKSIEIMGSEGHQLVSGLHTIAVRFNKAVLADGFKAYLQFFPRFRDHLRRLAAGTKVYATNRAHIASAELRFPPPQEQRAIAAALSDMDAEIAALDRRRDKTRALKQGMMQQLLTGSIRLPIQDAVYENGPCQ